MAEEYEVRVQGRFSAVHQLRLADGRLEPIHGHDWRVEVVFRGPRLKPTGVLIDFEEVAARLKDALADLEHGNLNTLPALAGQNPTAERVARLIFYRIGQHLDPDRPPAAVYVEEAPGCVAGYRSEYSETS